MVIILWIFVGLFVLGVGIAIYEWRKKRTLMAHDFNTDAKQSAELHRDIHNANQVFLHTPFH